MVAKSKLYRIEAWIFVAFIGVLLLIIQPEFGTLLIFWLGWWSCFIFNSIGGKNW